MNESRLEVEEGETRSGEQKRGQTTDPAARIGGGKRKSLGVVALLAAAAVIAGAWAVRDRTSWPDTAAADLRFLHDALGEHHPGPVDTVANPWFRAWYDRGFQEASVLAARADSYAGYHFALKRWAQGFQDAHLTVLRSDPLDDPRLSFRWPGIVLGWAGGGFVATHSGEPDVPAGARLRACDGRSSVALGGEILERYLGLWSVAGTRPMLAPYLLLDAGNPFVERPGTCTFDAEGRTVVKELRWRRVDADGMRTRIEGARRTAPSAFGVRRLASGAGTWIGLPSFDLRSDTVRREMDHVLESLRRDRDTIRRGPLVVLDVRGNRGGSSPLGLEVVEALWGGAVRNAVRPRGVDVDWRLSAANVGHLRDVTIPLVEERYGAGSSLAATYRSMVTEMEEALRRGETFYRQSGAGTTSPPTVPAHDVEARVYLLTDHVCVSACLDFADAVLAVPGVVHVGRETRADAVYIENRSVELPSGLGRLGLSMKVYRNRPRGHNESYRPAHAWDGDMADQAAVEAWLLELHGRLEPGS